MEKLLIRKLERLRKQMNELASREGLSHPEVLLISQQIDHLHNKINRLLYHSSYESKSSLLNLNIRRNMNIKESNKEIYAYLYEASAI